MTDVVLHLVPTARKPNRANTRIAAVGVVGGLAAVLVGFLRTTSGGQDSLVFVMAVLAGILIFGMVVAFGYLRLRNATLYIKGDRVGVTNALGIRSEVPIAEVSHIVKTTEDRYGEKTKVGVLLLVTKPHRRVIRFWGADRLGPGGVENVAAIIGVPIEGSWRELDTSRSA